MTVSGMSASTSHSMQRKGALYAGLISCLALAACQSVRPYAAPAGPATASLQFQTVLDAGMMFGLYNFDDAYSCGPMQRVFVGNAQSPAQSSSLRAGELNTFEYVGLDRA